MTPQTTTNERLATNYACWCAILAIVSFFLIPVTGDYSYSGSLKFFTLWDVMNKSEDYILFGMLLLCPIYFIYLSLTNVENDFINKCKKYEWVTFAFAILFALGLFTGDNEDSYMPIMRVFSQSSLAGKFIYPIICIGGLVLSFVKNKQLSQSIMLSVLFLSGFFCGYALPFGLEYGIPIKNILEYGISLSDLPFYIQMVLICPMIAIAISLIKPSKQGQLISCAVFAFPIVLWIIGHEKGSVVGALYYIAFAIVAFFATKYWNSKKENTPKNPEEIKENQPDNDSSAIIIESIQQVAGFASKVFNLAKDSALSNKSLIYFAAVAFFYALNSVVHGIIGLVLPIVLLGVIYYLFGDKRKDLLVFTILFCLIPIGFYIYHSMMSSFIANYEYDKLESTQFFAIGLQILNVLLPFCLTFVIKSASKKLPLIGLSLALVIFYVWEFVTRAYYLDDLESSEQFNSNIRLFKWILCAIDSLLGLYYIYLYKKEANNEQEE